MTLLRQRDPRILLAVSGLSSVGDFVAFVVLTVRVFELSGGSGIGVGALLLTLVLPGVVLIPVAGWLVDHFETRRVLVVTSVFQALVVAGLALTNSMIATFALAFLLGAGVAVARPAAFALLPRVAGPRHVTELNAWYQTVYFGGAALGPAAGGFLLELSGARWALLIDAVTFVVMALGSAALRATRPPSPEAEAEGGGGSSWRQGVTVVTRDRVVLIMVLVTALAILMVGAANVGEVFLAKAELGAGDIGYGLLNGSWMLGLVLLVTTLARRLRPDQLVPGLLLGMLTASVMTLAAGLAPTIWVAVAVYFIGGGGNGIGNVTLRSAIQHRIPDHLLGRAFATFGGLASAAEISSSALGGALVEIFGVRGSMVALGAAGTLAAVAGFIGYFRLPAAARAMPEREGVVTAAQDGHDGTLPPVLASGGPTPDGAPIALTNPAERPAEGRPRTAP